MTSPEVSIIVPAYNEGTLIINTLDGLQSYMWTRSENYEVIIVDDGSQDKTVSLIRDWQKSNSMELKFLINQTNMGKGFSVRRGVIESRGKYVIFIDADLPYELDAIDGFMNALKSGCDLAVGSRILPESKVRGVSVLRYIAGQVFSWLERFLLFTKVADTQCGF